MNIFPTPNPRYFRQLYYLSQFKKHQWLKEEYLIRIQEKRLRALIKHAYHNVPFYNDLLDSEGIKPEDINSVKDLQKIPILTKESVRKNYPDKIVTKGVNIAKCHNSSTTGSTGMPLKISFGSNDYDNLVSSQLFVWLEQGLRLKDKFVSIRYKGLLTDNNILFRILGIFNWENIDIFDPIEDIYKAFTSSKADVLWSYPSIIQILSQEIEKKNGAGKKPRLILCAGETLTDSNRNKIINILNSDIYRTYATVEFGPLAFECKERSGYHLISDRFIVEFVKDEKHVGEGEEGEIVVTSLTNYTMPLIRYKLGDIGTFTSETCLCGKGYPLIKGIEGRTDDFLIMPSGRKISPRVINVIEDIPGVSLYKTVQEAKNRIVVNLVKGEGFGEGTISEIKKHIKDGCRGEDIEVDVKLVEEIPLDKGGKLRAVISNVKG